jgi:RNA polymerase sigma factor (sigma-70 family)
MDAERSNSLVRYIYHAVRRHHDGDATDTELLQRFVAHRDEAAFAALVRRYGPLVFGACRRVLHHRQDAEDAFQATFLVLLHKASSIARPELVGNWLYGVASYTAKNAKISAARRRAREKRVFERSRDRSLGQEEKKGDLRMLLDEELSRLPQKYRVPVVLCELQGKSRRDVAVLLGCPEGTVSSRLARARQLLRAQLTKRGLVLSAGALTAALSPDPTAASPPALFVASTIRTAMRVTASQASFAGITSPHVAALTKGVLKTMFFAKLRAATASLLAMSILLGAGVLAHQMLAAKPEQPPSGTPLANQKPGRPTAKPEPAVPAHGTVVGRFTAADTGKPLAGVKIRVLIEGVPGKAPFAETSSDTDGRYTVTVPLGHCRLLGVYAPAGYYTQSSRTFDMIATTSAKPRIVRDFVLEPGSPWHVELQGATAPPDKPPFFSASPNPERQGGFPIGEIISTVGDARGKAVLTIPTAGGRYRFTCGLLPSPSPYEIPAANLEIDKDFDPRHIQGKPAPVADRNAVRLRDAAGRVAVAEGVQVVVETGQAVLRFHAQPIPKASALRLHGAAVDEAGKPVAGAKVTAAFATGDAGRPRSAAMSQLETLTDAQGKFEFPHVLLPLSFYEPDCHLSMIVFKAGFDGAQTKELSLRAIKQAGHGDFGTVVLRPGHTLRGKVVDENARPVHGAVVTNHTNYFLYSNLQCRTDAEGRFVMPDLSFGSQKLSAHYGERFGEEEFQFDEKSGDCVITVLLQPKSGIVPDATPAPVQPAQLNGAYTPWAPGVVVHQPESR